MAPSSRPFWTVPPRLAGVAAITLLLGTTPLLGGMSPASAAPASTCSSDPSARLADVPSPETALGFPLGTGQERVVTGPETGFIQCGSEELRNRILR